MRKIFTLFVLLFCFKNAKAQYVTIPDPNFVNMLQIYYAPAMNGNQMDTTHTMITTKKFENFGNWAITDLTGIQYFDSLISFGCSNNQLQTLPKFPSQLKILDCSYNQLTTFAPLPNSLENLSCTNNLFVNLPPLPSSLKKLDCIFNSLTSLPILPSSLQELYCGFNQITGLPVLPSSLKVLDCSYNQITILPTLPNSLLHLECSSNQITALPALPNSLLGIGCNYNLLTSLPTLPISLLDFLCSNNNITSFDAFNPLSWIDISNNPFTCLPNYISAMNAATIAYPLCSQGNLNGCPNAMGITGFSYKDNNNDCIKNNSDIGLKNIKYKLYDSSNNLINQTYPFYNGLYNFNISTANTYSVIVDTVNAPFIASCTYPGLDSSIVVTQLDTNINFALSCKPGFDLGINSITTIYSAFPGQMHYLTINAGDVSHWYNLNCASGIGGTLTFEANGPVTYIGPAVGSKTPTVSGNVFTYTIGDFGTVNNISDFRLLFVTDTTAQAGNDICITSTITPVSGDNNSFNNTFQYCYQVVNSHDPNIKEVYPLNVPPGFNDWLTYTIHFQNTGNADAYNIRLADTLDNMLDLETFQIINYSHYNNTSINGNVITIRFPNIMLPDSASNPSSSIGYIQYRIKPKSTWAAPYQIKNTAYIYFDYNAPIVTNTTYNTILVPTSIHNQSETIASIYPNPTKSTFTIELNTKEKQLIQLIDITGNIVLSQTIENGKGIIDASYLASGIYNISIKTSAGITNKKLVIVK